MSDKEIFSTNDESISRRDFLEKSAKLLATACVMPVIKNISGYSESVTSNEPSEEEIDFIAKHEIVQGDTSRNVVMMTYDDMGSEEQIEQILSAYRPYPDCKATFFYLGDKLEWSAKSIQKIVDEGHLLGSHFWNHSQMSTLSSDRIKRWFELNISTLEKIVPGYRMKYFRMPYGDGVSDERILKVAAQFGLQHVYWTTGSNGLVPDTYQKVLWAAKPGAIILSHMFRRYDYTQANLIVEGLLEKGFSLETVDTGKSPADRYIP
jgi:peptidoglycan-N-acetylmuramic acid deacetylase